MPTCTPSGFGSGGYGTAPSGGVALPDIGGPLPAAPPFDIYCVGPCGQITYLLSHPEVSTVLAAGSTGQFPISTDPSTAGDQLIASGGVAPATGASIIINDAVPENFTLEYTLWFYNLPANFSNMAEEYFFVGASSENGSCCGLFFSKVGIAYTGAVHLEGASLVLDSPLETLPNSQTLVLENQYWVVRTAVSLTTGAVYIYVTPQSEIGSGPQLQYVMPAFPSSSAARTPDNWTIISALGLATAEVEVSLDTIALGTGVVIPEVPPTANAGYDQALRLCEILQLNGAASFDPQGSSVTYFWRLIDAPFTSQCIENETDGFTYPLNETDPLVYSSGTGYTNKLFSASLSEVNAADPIKLNDVVVVQGTAYSIVTVGSGPQGFYVQITAFDLPDDLSTPTTFTFLRQSGINTPVLVNPTFYPDEPGIYKFDLKVYNGSEYSEPSEVIANVVESSTARGVIPDLSFMWNYLSNFWSLVEGTERITVFWQALAQVAASELLRLWQFDYNKSLRDIQRTFQRRWLHYDLLMQENPALYSVSTVRAVLGGMESADIEGSVGGIAGTHLDLQLAVSSNPVSVHFTAADPYTADQIQAVIYAALQQVDTSTDVEIISTTASYTGTPFSRVRIDAPYVITVLESSTCPLYDVGQSIGAPTGTAGAGVVTTKVYKVERSLSGLDISLNDFLCINGVAYRIASTLDNPADEFPYQRLLLLDDLPAPAGTSWTIAGTVTSDDLDFWNGLCEVSDQVQLQVLALASQQSAAASIPVLGSSAQLASNLPVDASSVAGYLARPSLYSVTLSGVLRRKYIPIDPLLVDVPILQEYIINTDDTQCLRRNIDFFFDTFRGQPCIRFVTPVPANLGGADVWQGGLPPAQMWAETSYVDNRPYIEANFGIPAQFTLADLAQLPTNIDYLSAVQGLWYTYWNGPTVEDIRIGAQILLGLPFAEQEGTILSMRDDFSSTTGQILVQDTANTAIVREYTYPPSLTPEINPATGREYAVGDTVSQFAPLVRGVEIYDWVNNPTWFQGYVSQGAFLEIQKYEWFLVRVASPAFDYQAMIFAQGFVKRIKPTYTSPLFIIDLSLGTTGDTTVAVDDETVFTGHLHLYDGALTFDSKGQSTMFDQPRAAGGGWRNQFDTSNTPPVPWPPTPSNPPSSQTLPVRWGYDTEYLAPETAISGICHQTCSSYTPAPVPTDIFGLGVQIFYSTPSWDNDRPGAAVFSNGMMFFVTPSASSRGVQIGGTQTVTEAGTITDICLELQAIDTGHDALNNPITTFLLVVMKNGSTVTSQAFVPTPSIPGSPDFKFDYTLPDPVSVSEGDVITCFISATGTSSITMLVWQSVLVTMGKKLSWSSGTPVPDGDYYAYRAL
jgi:hypothetical protein